MPTKYYIVMKRKYKRKFIFFKTIEYERPTTGYYDIEYAEGQIYKLEKLLGSNFDVYIEEIFCFNRDE